MQQGHIKSKVAIFIMLQNISISNKFNLLNFLFFKESMEKNVSRFPQNY